MHITFWKGGVSATMNLVRMHCNRRSAAFITADETIVPGTPQHIDLSGLNYRHRGVRVQTEALKT